jgi:hypothetical protein
VLHATHGLLHLRGAGPDHVRRGLGRRGRRRDAAVVFQTLKKRRAGVFWAVPVPQTAPDTLDLVHRLSVGHASPGVKAIYADALGEEQQAIAARMW